MRKSEFVFVLICAHALKQSFAGMTLTLGAFLLLCLAITGTQSTAVPGVEVEGVLKGSADDDGGQLLRVDLVRRDGTLEQRSLVHATSGRFTLRNVHNGVYALSVVGNTAWSYAPLRIDVMNGKVQVENRRDPLLIPGEGLQSSSANSTHPFPVYMVGRATMLAPQSGGWTISSLLGNRFLMFQVVAISFVILFPRYLKTLDKETLAELTGEVEQVSVDPNEAIKGLMDYEDGVEHEIIAPLPQ